MVRLTLTAARNAVIKFRKGGLAAQSRKPAASASAPAAAAAPSSSPAGCPINRSQPATAMSTSSCAIPDIDLPLRYRRAPLSQEEIDKINGGGIV